MPRREKPFSMPELIAKKRDGGALTGTEIEQIIERFVDGRVPDYQMSALSMAICLRGMSFDETVALTLAMRDSGKVMRFEGIDGIKVGKHSTGGVGDKVSLCLIPMVASCGLVVPKMSGRGLGHTGGTLDKLESIPGFRIDLSAAEFGRQLRKVGSAIIGQTKQLAPADKKLYALRDVTGTVESIPLITSSILSKKLAEGIDALVLDVKCGRGAFMKTEESGRELARSLVRVGRLAGKQVSAVLTDMNTPLGDTVGNAIEVIEALRFLHGEGPADLEAVTLAIGAEMLTLGGAARTKAQAERQLRDTLSSQSALSKMRELVQAQGGDPRVVDEPDRLALSKARASVQADCDGYVGEIDPLAIGYASVALGAGRQRAEQAVDLGAGIELHVTRGDAVRKGEALATLYAARRSLVSGAKERVRQAFSLRATKPRPRTRVIGTIRR